MARGRYAKAICDRCGDQYPYRKLDMESGTKLMVCRDCNDGRYNRVDHPQNKPVYVADTFTIRDPSPDRPYNEEVPTFIEDQDTDTILGPDGHPIDI